MQGLLGPDPVRVSALGAAAEPLLAHGDAPALVADVDEDVAPAVEGAERDDLAAVVVAPADAQLEDLLDDEDGLLEGLARDADAGVAGDDADGAVLAHEDGGQVQVLDAVAQGGLGDVEERRDGGVGPRGHLGRQPALARDGREQVRGRGAELEQVVGLAAHDDEVLALGGGQLRGAGDGVEEAVEAGVVAVGGGVAGGGDDADLDVLAHEVEDARDDGARGQEALAVVVERHVAVEGGEAQGAVRGDGHELGRVEDEPDVVEGRRDEPPRRDVPLAVLELEGGLQRQPCEEGADRGHQELELGRDPGRVRLVRN